MPCSNKGSTRLENPHKNARAKRPRDSANHGSNLRRRDDIIRVRRQLLSRERHRAARARRRRSHLDVGAPLWQFLELRLHLSSFERTNQLPGTPPSQQRQNKITTLWKNERTGNAAVFCLHCELPKSPALALLPVKERHFVAILCRNFAPAFVKHVHDKTDLPLLLLLSARQLAVSFLRSK